MSTATEAKAGRLWISRRAATRLLNIGPKKLAELAVAGHIRFRAIPNGWTRYLAEDVFRLAEPTTTTTLQSA